jgi:hypothetical protein
MFRKQVAKWPDQEAEVRNWITDHKNNGISVCKKIIIYEGKR